ncbi:hypothetical protein Tsubulata_007412 [Turnera subulata]|uniref:Uncharacterized protein n=1 Tax=Turnera subulata TaxID=218843 RepID=A0A9Q0J6C5_9ROSI|nr:hypothetical protein Tsubulata_007412 [Turnera subulata]
MLTMASYSRGSCADFGQRLEFGDVLPRWTVLGRNPARFRQPREIFRRTRNGLLGKTRALDSYASNGPWT